MGNLVQDCFGSGDCKMIVDALASGHVPFQEGNQGAPAAQVRSQFRPGDAHELFRDGIGVVRDYDATTFPRSPVEIRDGPFHVQATAAGPPVLPIVPRQL
jgi:hypothetical protein